MTLASILKLVDQAHSFDQLLARDIAQYGFEKNPGNTEAMTAYINLCLNTEDLARFKNAIEKHKELVGEDDTYFHNCGVLDVHAGNLPSAIEKFEQSINFKWRIDSVGELCLHNLVLGRVEESAKYCHQVLNSEFAKADYGDLASYFLYFTDPSPQHIQLVNDAVALKSAEYFVNIYRMIAMRFHRAIEIVDNKTEFERLTRLSRSPVNRPKTYIFPDDAGRRNYSH